MKNCVPKTSKLAIVGVSGARGAPGANFSKSFSGDPGGAKTCFRCCLQYVISGAKHSHPSSDV